MSEDLQTKLNLCIQAYKRAYNRLPNAIIAPYFTRNFLLENKVLRDGGEQKGEYSGLLLKTEGEDIKIYKFGGMNMDELKQLNLPLRLEKDKRGHLFPLVFTTQLRLYWIRSRRFKDSLSCNIGASTPKLKSQLAKQIKKQKVK